MFGTNKYYTLERVPFSADGAFLSIYQATDDERLYFTICRSEPGIIIRRKLIRIEPVYEGEELPYIYYCDEARLTIETKKGTIEFVYEEPEILRVRVTGVSMRVYCEAEMHEGACEKAWGEVEIAFNLVGKLLFKSISGRLEHNIEWDFRTVSPLPFHIDIIPDEETGAGEAAIHEYYSNCIPKDVYPPFDMAYENTKADFQTFAKNYPEALAPYRDMAKKAEWIIWNTRLGPRGSLKNKMIYMNKVLFVRAFGWHHGFHAMAMENNVREAWNMLLVMFTHQNEYGGIPDNISDLNQEAWISTKPPIFGFATCYVLDNFDLSPLGTEDYDQLYNALSKYTNWWFTQHDHMKTGYASYYHSDESGYDEATLFDKGCPIQAPDLQAYMVMLCEACSRLAALTGREKETEYWMSESKRVLSFLTDVLWDGELFRARIPATGELYKCGSVAHLQPIMLGRRLPGDIVAKIRERLLDEDEYLTDCGIASEHLKSEHVVVRSFTRGAVTAPSQCLMLLGLHDAGEVEAAQMITARYLNVLMGKGLGHASYTHRVEPVIGNKLLAMETTPMSIGYWFSAWVSSIFLILANKVMK